MLIGKYFITKILGNDLKIVIYNILGLECGYVNIDPKRNYTEKDREDLLKERFGYKERLGYKVEWYDDSLPSDADCKWTVYDSSTEDIRLLHKGAMRSDEEGFREIFKV